MLLKNCQHLGLLVLIKFAMLVVPFGTQAQSSDEDVFHETKAYALKYGVTVDEVKRRDAIIDAAGDLQVTLRRREAATFAGIHVEHTPRFRVVVQFTDRKKKDISPYTRDKNLRAAVQTRRANFSMANLEKAQAEALAFVASAGIPAESGIIQPLNRVELYVVEPDQLNTALQKAYKQLPPSVAVIPVPSMGKYGPGPAEELGTTEIQSQAKAGKDRGYGGMKVITPSGSGYCTTGFSVIHKQSGVKGFTTAGHCPDDMLRSNFLGLSFEGQVDNAVADVQWHSSSSVNFVPKIKIETDGTERAIKSVKLRAQQVVGTFVCKYGVTTFKTCGIIYDKDYTIPTGPDAITKHVRVDNSHSQWPTLGAPGDSGAPWYNDKDAYGTLKGGPAEDPNDAVYMAIDYVNRLDGVSVMLAK